jgi:hypothetical protein
MRVCACVFVRVHVYVHVRACEYSRAFILYVCMCAHECVYAYVCAYVRASLYVCTLLPHRRCSGVHDAVLEHYLLKQA